MNAGAYGGEMKDVIREATLLTPEGEVRAVPADQMEFGYRTSIAARTGQLCWEPEYSCREAIRMRSGRGWRS